MKMLHDNWHNVFDGDGDWQMGELVCICSRQPTYLSPDPVFQLYYNHCEYRYYRQLPPLLQPTITIAYRPIEM